MHTISHLLSHGHAEDPVGSNPQPGNVIIRGVGGTMHWSESPTPVLSYSYADGSLSDHNFANSNWVSAGSYLPASGNRLNLETGGGNLAALRSDIDFALDALEEVANLTFNYNSSYQTSGVDFKIMAYNNSGLNGVATFPGTDQMFGTAAPTNDYESFILYNNNSSSMATTPELGGSSNRLHTVIHEIGHSLGLGHPHDTGTGTINITGGSAFTYNGDNEIDNDRYTVMSYERGGLNQNSQSLSYGYAVVPMALDIAALHYLYGSRTNHTSNTTYTLTDPMTVARDLDGDDGTVSIGRAFYGIWDTGGTDEIEYNGSRNVLINLNEATLNQSSDPFVITEIIADLNASSLFDTILPVVGGAELRDDLLDREFHAGGFFSRIFSNGGAADLGGYSIANDLYADTGHTTIIENASGSGGTDILIGNEQNNVLDGGSGNDLLIGADGNDTLIGGFGTDELMGGDGNDSLDGGNSVDTLDGGSGNDTLVGSFSTDLVRGGAGNDLIRVDSGQFYDSVDGGSGTDTLDHSASTYSGNIFNFDSGLGSGSGYSMDATLASIEVFLDGSGSNTVYSDGSMNYMGNGGNDAYYERTTGGTDIVDMGSGSDTLHIRNTGLVGDTWNGGSGTDTVNFSAITYAPGTHIDLGGGNVGGETLLNFENVVGSQGNDSISGSNTANVIDGQGGDDTISGVGAGNTIDGGAGDDLIHDASAGTDTFEGGLGNDTLVSDIDWVNTVVFDMMTGERIYNATTYDLFTGIENLTVGGGADVVGDGNANHIIATDTGTSHSNHFDGGAGNDTLEGGIGNDTLLGGGGTDHLMGGSGNDLLSQGLGGPNETLDGGTGNDTGDWSYNLSDNWIIDLMAGTANIGATIFANLISIENVIGGGADDQIIGTSGANRLEGGAGDDWVEGANGADTLIGGPGADTLSYDTDIFGVNVNLNTGFANGGHATGDVFSGFDHFLGGIGADNAVGSGSANGLRGAAGNDTLNGLGGHDTLNGGLGNDLLLGGGGNDLLIGQNGNDTLFGHAGNDVLGGGGNDDVLNGGSGDDTLNGSSGNDLIEGSIGADSMNGGGGNDTLDYSNDALGVTINLLIDAASGGEAAGDSIFGFENIFSGSGDDRLIGSADDNFLNAGTGNDTVTAKAGDDTLLGQAGDDRLIGGSGNDSLVGGAGDDTLNGQSGDDRLLAKGNNDLVLGGTGDDFIVGGGGNDTLSGQGDNDTLLGQSGNDFIYGGGGDDSIIGGGGSDTLRGQGGNDLLNGHVGQDELSGGGGNDTFKFSGVAHSSTGVTDTITDWAVGNNIIDVSAIDANVTGGSPGNDAFVFVGNAAHSGAGGTLRYYQSGGNTFVGGDVDGDGTDDMLIRLDGLHVLTAGDFIL